MNRLKNRQVSQGPQQLTAVSHYQGILPPPEMLKQFNDIDSTFANRIMMMAEKEQENRHYNEKRITRNILRMSVIGMGCAFLSVLIISSLVMYALYLGYANPAATIAVGAIAAVASVFIFFKRFVKTTKP